jgi:hypothetical protein
MQATTVIGHERPTTRTRWWLAGAALLIGTLGSLARQPGVGALNTVWAEDGEVFLADAVNEPLPVSVFTSYAGYFHLGPRLLAEIAAAVPVGWAGAVLAISAAAVTAALAVLVYVASAAYLHSTVARVVAAAIVVVAPLAQDDVPNSIANLHWPGLYALFWVLLWTPIGRSGRVVAGVTVALVAASDILVVALVPLAVFQFLRLRGRYRATLASVLAAGVALQLLGLVLGASSRDTELDPVRAGTGYLLRAVPAALVGSRWLGDDHRSVRWLALAAVAWLLVVAVVLLAWRRRLPRPAWTLAALAGVHSVALYALPVFLSGTAPGRYALAPAMLLVVAMLALLPTGSGRDSAATVEPPTGGWLRPAVSPAVVFVTLLAIVCAVNLRVPNLRAEGPTWSGELSRERTECGPASDAVLVRLPPANGDWYADLPCDYIDR